MRPVTEDQFAYWRRVPTRWGDMDALGHVNNAKFFSYDETVRLDYFGSLLRDDPGFWKEYGLILAHIEADFIAQLRAPADLDIGFRIARLGGKSLQTEAGMFHEGRLIAVTRAVVVWFDYPRNASLAIPDAVRARIRAIERLKPEEG